MDKRGSTNPAPSKRPRKDSPPSPDTVTTTTTQSSDGPLDTAPDANTTLDWLNFESAFSIALLIICAATVKPEMLGKLNLPYLLFETFSPLDTRLNPVKTAQNVSQLHAYFYFKGEESQARADHDAAALLAHPLGDKPKFYYDPLSPLRFYRVFYWGDTAKFTEQTFRAVFDEIGKKLPSSAPAKPVLLSCLSTENFVIGYLASAEELFVASRSPLYRTIKLIENPFTKIASAYGAQVSALNATNDPAFTKIMVGKIPSTVSNELAIPGMIAAKHDFMSNDDIISCGFIREKGTNRHRGFGFALVRNGLKKVDKLVEAWDNELARRQLLRAEKKSSADIRDTSTCPFSYSIARPKDKPKSTAKVPITLADDE